MPQWHNLNLDGASLFLPTVAQESKLSLMCLWHGGCPSCAVAGARYISLMCLQHSGGSLALLLVLIWQRGRVCERAFSDIVPFGTDSV